MKSIYKLKINSFALIMCTFFYTCKDPFKGIDIIADANVYNNAPVNILFLNANENNLQPIGDFPVVVSGPDADKVINEVGKKDFKVVGGILTLGLQEGIKPSQSNKIQFHINAQIEGYVPLSQTIVLDSDSASQYVIKMSQYSSLPEGTSAMVGNSTTLSGNTNANAKNFTLDSKINKPEKANILLQAGTQFLAENGAVLNGNSLTSNIVHYSTGTEASLDAFPGGFMPQNIQDENGNTLGAGSFVTAGFLSIDMKVGNQKVKKFSKPLKVEMEVNSAIINPSTGSALKVGDEIPVWSMDEETGIWKKESTAKIVNESGKLKVHFDINHLSYWNLDFYGPICSRNSTITINANAVAANKYYTLKLVTPNGQPLTNYATSSRYINQGNNTITLYNMPNLSAKLLIYDYYSGEKVTESTIFNPCSGQGMTIALNPAPKDIVLVNVNIAGRCASKNYEVRPYVPIYVYTVNANGQKQYSFYTYINAGIGSFYLENNVKYHVETYFDGKVNSAEFVFNKNAIDIPTKSGLSGTFTYNQASNSSNLKAIYSIPNCK